MQELAQLNIAQPNSTRVDLRPVESGANWFPRRVPGAPHAWKALGTKRAGVSAHMRGRRVCPFLDDISHIDIVLIPRICNNIWKISAIILDFNYTYS